jgi:hypothetical protein
VYAQRFHHTYLPKGFTPPGLLVNNNNSK